MIWGFLLFSFAYNHPFVFTLIQFDFLLNPLTLPHFPTALTLFYPFLPCHPDTLFLSSWVCEVANV